MDPFLGEIRIFAGNYAPRAWADCDGTLLPIAQFDALFSLLGTTYGGDGETTFGVPDLQGRVPLHFGQGRGLSKYSPGEQGGAEAVALREPELPLHTHALFASTDTGNNANPQGNVLAATGDALYTQAAASVPLAGSAITPTGNSQPHENRMPFIAIRYIIALEGVYPPHG
jgi:microcystin-dependent protein